MGGEAKYKKKMFAQGKIKWKKNHARQSINPKKYSCYALKKIQTKEFDYEQKFLHSKIPPPPPHNLSSGPSLNGR